MGAEKTRWMVKRRVFLQIAGGVGVVKVASPGESMGAETPIKGQDAAKSPTPMVVKSYSNDQHRQRLQNIAACERSIKSCMRKHLITDYLPGQCTYNLGEYPCRKVWNPDEWDERELDRLKAHGISLVQVHEEWSDAERLFGGDKFTPVNPTGFRRFVEMVHERGMKLIVYASSGFFERRDRDFRPEWARTPDLIEVWYDYAHCSPASPGWRAYLLPRLVRILDDYGVDGFYNDLVQHPRLTECEAICR